jgi:hypothetical protein
MPTTTERVHADHTVTKRLGHWTDSDHVEVRARGGAVVLDLRSPKIPDEIEIHVELRRAMVKLLLPEDAVVDHWDLRMPARGKVKDSHRGSAPSGTADRRIRLVGLADDSEIRIHRGGVAIMSAMCSREYLRDLRAAHKEGRHPTIDDPARTSR